MIVNSLLKTDPKVFEDFIIKNLANDLYITDITYKYTRISKDGEGYVCFNLEAFTPKTVRRSPGEDPDELDVFFYDDKIRITGLSEYEDRLSNNWIEEVMIPNFGMKIVKSYKSYRDRRKKAMNIMYDLETNKNIKKYTHLAQTYESNK